MLASTPFTVALKEVLGARFRVHPQEVERFRVAGVTPKLVLSPRTVEEGARAVAIIAAERATCIIRGAGTKSERPPALREIDAVVDTSELSGVLAHTPGDLTATVAAGTPLHELQAALHAHGQFFPCDPPFAARATIGGTLAANATGALRQRYGALRDNVLGMRVALSDGVVAFSGAKVVKSVAGYDSHKAFIGSYGTLGLIGEITLKVAPLPATGRLLVAVFDDGAAACAAATAIARSPLFVLATTLHDARAAARTTALRGGAGAWTLVVRCGGSRSATGAQFEGSAAECRAAGALQLRDLDAELVAATWSDLVELAGGAQYPHDRYVVAKFVALPSQTFGLAKAVRDAWPEVEISAHPSVGVLFAHVPVEAWREPGAAFWQQLEHSGWSATYLAVPPERADEFLAPLPAASPVKLQRRLKAAFDPTGTFDPGRMRGGI